MANDMDFNFCKYLNPIWFIPILIYSWRIWRKDCKVEKTWVALMNSRNGFEAYNEDYISNNPQLLWIPGTASMDMYS